MDRKHAVRQLQKLALLSKHMRLAADGWNARWKTLVAIIMSARTRDEKTIVIAEKLFKKYRKVSDLACARTHAVEQIIRQVNFYRNKTRSIIECAKVLSAQFKGVPPQSIEELLLLPGVGRKTANVFLAQYGDDAIGVDTHVAHIARSLRWTQHSDPHKIEKDLSRLFPKHLWRTINAICVQFGKTYTSRARKKLLLYEILLY